MSITPKGLLLSDKKSIFNTIENEQRYTYQLTEKEAPMNNKATKNPNVMKHASTPNTFGVQVEEEEELKASFGFIMSSRLAWATEQALSKTKKK